MAKRERQDGVQVCVRMERNLRSRLRRRAANLGKDMNVNKLICELLEKALVPTSSQAVARARGREFPEQSDIRLDLLAAEAKRLEELDQRALEDWD